MGGRTPPSPAAPRAPHDIRGWGARRAQAPAEEGGGRGPTGAALESAPPPRAPSLRAVPAPRSARASLPAPRLGRKERAPRTAASAGRSSPAPAFLRLLLPLLLRRRRRRRTRSRRPGPGRSWGVRDARSQPFPLRLPHRRPPPLALLLSPPCSFAFSSSSPGPGCQHHVRRGRFWESTEKIQVGVPRGAER